MYPFRLEPNLWEILSDSSILLLRSIYVPYGGRRGAYTLVYPVREFSHRKWVEPQPEDLSALYKAGNKSNISRWHTLSL